jgi:2-phosphosulfolactate phosphatase
MRVHVAFTPAERIVGPVAVVVDVLRATSTIAQAFAGGYRRVICCDDADDARALRDTLPDAIVGGERGAVRIAGFDAGASPREFREPRAPTLVLSTTNGTRAVVAAAREAEEVLLGSLLNLGAVAAAVRATARDATIVCAGFQGAFALDDAYCAGRIADAIAGNDTDAAKAARLLAASFPDSHAGLTARTYGPPGLEEDIRYCAQESVLDVVPRVVRLSAGRAEIAAVAAPPRCPE